MKIVTAILLTFVSITLFAQTDEFYRSVDWKFYPEQVVQLTDSTYSMMAMPFDYNDPGAINRVIGNYVVDFIGHRYAVIDSTYTTITVYDIHKIGQAPQSSQIAKCYRSVGNRDAKYIGSVDYSPLDESARWKLNGSDNELLWRNDIKSLSVTGTTTKTITITKFGGETLTSTFTDSTSVGGLGFYKILPVSGYSISETYNTAFKDTLYKLDLSAWYFKTISGKTVRVNNAISNYRKYNDGFSFSVDTIAGFIEYSIGGGGGSGGVGIEEAPVDGKKYARKDAGWIQVTSGSGSTTAVSNETPSGTINGTNAVFSLSQQPADNSERVYINGIRQAKPYDYSITNQDITFTSAPFTDELITVDYDIGVVLNQVYNETPSGTINGTNLVFTLANNVVDNQIAVFVNGVRQIYTTDYTVLGDAITFVVAPETNDILLTDYKTE